MKLCVIVPRLPPALDGIGDYCHQLWSHIDDLSLPTLAADVQVESKERWQWSFLVTDGAVASRRAWPQLEISSFELTAEHLQDALQRLDANTVLLQYVGYGYAINGAPSWLAPALSRWKSAAATRKVVIMFHETWSSGKPWQRVFWQMSAQKKCVAALLKVCDIAVTSMKANADSLKVIDPTAAVRIIPIGSSFDLDASVRKDWRKLLIFGKQSSRGTCLNRHAQLIKELSSKGLLDQIVCAGQCEESSIAADEKFIHSLGVQVPVAGCYNFAPALVPDAVRECGLSLMHTQSTNLLKSTSFQLAAQLGQVAIAIEERTADAPFQVGKHYLSYVPPSLQAIVADLKNEAKLSAISSTIVSAAHQQLSWNQISRTWYQLLSRDDPPEQF